MNLNIIIKCHNRGVNVLSKFINLDGEILVVRPFNLNITFCAGEKVICIIGDQQHLVTLLKVHNGLCYMYLPFCREEGIIEKRRYPRFPVKMKGEIVDYVEATMVDNPDMQPVSIQDISIRGFLIETCEELKSNKHYLLKLTLGPMIISPKIVIMNVRNKNNNKHYGTEIVTITMHDDNILKFFINKIHLETLVKGGGLSKEGAKNKPIDMMGDIIEF